MKCKRWKNRTNERAQRCDSMNNKSLSQHLPQVGAARHLDSCTFPVMQASACAGRTVTYDLFYANVLRTTPAEPPSRHDETNNAICNNHPSAVNAGIPRPPSSRCHMMADSRWLADWLLCFSHALLPRWSLLLRAPTCSLTLLPFPPRAPILAPGYPPRGQALSGVPTEPHRLRCNCLKRRPISEHVPRCPETSEGLRADAAEQRDFQCSALTGDGNPGPNARARKDEYYF